MRILPILAFTCLFGSISFAQGQSRTPSRPEPAQPAANAPAADTVDKSLPPAAVNGIRFVLKEPMSLPSPIYMPIDSKRLEKVEIRAALPGRRSVYPKSKIITLFGGLDQKGMPTNKLVSKPLPPDLGSKTLALVGKNSKGELTLDFINESELPLNCVYIQNLTGRTFTLELPKPPSGEKSAIELPSKSTYIFGKNSTDSNISHPRQFDVHDPFKERQSRQGEGQRHDADDLPGTKSGYDYFPGFHRPHRRFDGTDDFQGKAGSGFL